MGKEWKLLQTFTNDSCRRQQNKVVERFVVTRILRINEKPGRIERGLSGTTPRRQSLRSCGERQCSGQKGREPRGVCSLERQVVTQRNIHLPYYPTVLFCHTSNTRWTASCQKTLSACLLNGSRVCGRYCFRVLYFHARRACKAAGARGRGYVWQKCSETSNITLFAER